MVTSSNEFHKSSNLKDATQGQETRSDRDYTDVDPEHDNDARASHFILVSVIRTRFHDLSMAVSPTGQPYLHQWLSYSANLSILPTKNRTISMRD